MEIKGCDKQLLIFLQTLEAKSVSSCHKRRMYIITEQNGAQVQLQIFQVSPGCYTPKLGFSGQQGVHLIHRKLR